MTELNFALMEAEPTLAAITPEDETQSLHAWSQADDGDAITEYIPQRSWKFPALVTVLAASAAVTAAAFLAWPESATNPLVAPEKPNVAAPAHPSIAPSPPLQAQSPDQRFLALIQQRGIRIVSQPLAVAAAHWVCTQEAKGYPDPDIAQALVNSTPGSNLKTESIFVDTTREVYCP